VFAASKKFAEPFGSLWNRIRLSNAECVEALGACDIGQRALERRGR